MSAMRLVGGSGMQAKLDQLYKSDWWQQALRVVEHGKHGTRVDAEFIMLRAASYVAGWDADNPNYQALVASLNVKAANKPAEYAIRSAVHEPPPSIAELSSVGIDAQEADFRASMPVYTPPEAKKALPMEEQAEVKDPTVRERYGHMRCLRYGFNTAPRALVKYAKKLGLDPRSFLIIQTISNAKPGKALEQKWIADRSLCERQTVNKVIGQLQNRGLILVTKGRGKFAASTYDLAPLWERLDEIDQKFQEDEAG